MTTNTNQENKFFGLGIAPGLLEVIAKLKFTTPTPIQEKAIPVAVTGTDVIGIAQTGTGKTLAFGIPMVQRLAQEQQGRGLVVVPTRELAMQVNETMVKLAPAFKMKTVVLIGGQSMVPQIQGLRANPRIIIATPGRLLDHMEKNTVRLNDMKILVLDEADRMLDMGFMPQIRQILNALPKERQTMLFSATMPADIVEIAAKHMKMPVRTEIAPQGTAADTVTQEIFVVRGDRKMTLLQELLKQYTGSILLFARTKRGASKVTRYLRHAGFPAAEIHSDRSMGQRKEALQGFKSGRHRILVATDIAARGIDVTGIEVVINYDLPDEHANYVHRIGRTGRAGMKGHAISLATPEQAGDVRQIEKIIRTTIPVSIHPTVPTEKFPERPAFSGGQLLFSSGKKIRPGVRRARPWR
jgi:ATP-dependent RNA helicase RhlE